MAANSSKRNEKFENNVLYALLRALAEEGSITEDEFSKCVEKFINESQMTLCEQ